MAIVLPYTSLDTTSLEEHTPLELNDHFAEYVPQCVHSAGGCSATAKPDLHVPHGTTHLIPSHMCHSLGKRFDEVPPRCSFAGLIDILQAWPDTYVHPTAWQIHIQAYTNLPFRALHLR